ncbi:nucleotidyltransferase family protein [Helicobacter sp. T3_23-1056]
MLSSNLKHIIIQAGGKGTRLEGLTRNKPKCLVPYNNLPIIFHLFAKFKGAKFTIIADYKIEVLQKYLAIFAPKFSVDYRILKAQNSGTIAGLREAMGAISESEPFMIIWCDLILSNEFTLPNMGESNIDSALDSSKSLSQNSIDSSTIPPPQDKNLVCPPFVGRIKILKAS